MEILMEFDRGVYIYILWKLHMEFCLVDLEMIWCVLAF